MTDAEMIAELEAASAKLPQPPCLAVRVLGTDPNLPPLARLFNSSGESFTEKLWLDDAEAVVALINNRDRLIALAKIGMRTLALSDGLQRFGEGQDRRADGESGDPYFERTEL